MRPWHWLALLAVLAVAGYGGYEMTRTPRGIRNNNPGNIEKGAPWQGLATVQDDPRFATFEDPRWGIRAMARILRNYQERHGLDTVREIIGRWAPSVENDTSAYAEAVAARMGVDPDEPLIFNDGNLASLVAAMIHHENGEQPYSERVIATGIEWEQTGGPSWG